MTNQGELIMPLVIAPIDVDLKIVRVNADEKTKKHLQSLGVVINGIIKVLSSNGGNVICEVLGVRIALNKDIAMKIFVA